MNLPRKGKCGRCQKTGLIRADFGLDVLMIHAERDSKKRLLGGSVLQSGWRIDVPLCQKCFRQVMTSGQPQVHLSSRGVTVRLTRKQAEAAARKRERELVKQETERETEGGE